MYYLHNHYINNCYIFPVAEAVAAVLPGLAGIAHPSDVLDMPVDPNEPTYCLCHQVSYGEMIGCDNPDVSFVQPFLYIVLMIVISIYNSVRSSGSILLAFNSPPSPKANGTAQNVPRTERRNSNSIIQKICCK